MNYITSTQKETIAKNKVFIDGISRTGKSIFSIILPAFEKMEHIQFFDLIEWLIPAAKYGGMNINYLNSILRIAYNQLYYNLFISRNVNFRKSDQTGINNFRDPEIYYSRLEKVDNDGIVKEIINTEFYVPFMTHDLMVNMDIVKKIDLDCKILEIYRNPIDIVYSWWRRGLGTRLGNDPREFTLLININNLDLPWYCAEIDDLEKFSSYNELERIITIVLSLINRSVIQHKSLKNNGKIYTLTYEETVEKTDEVVKNIGRFLKLKPSKVMTAKLKEINLPRTLNENDNFNKVKVIKKHICSEKYNDLVDMALSYNNNLYGLKS